MAHTRGITPSMQGDGELLDKEGKPIPTSREAALKRAPAMDDGGGELVLAAPRPKLAPVRPQVFEYVCDRTTWHKSASPWDVLMLLDMYLGGLTTKLDMEAFSRLSPDVRRHFRRVMVVQDEAA